MRFYIRRLGCPKNDVDADYLAARIMAGGLRPTGDPQKADVIIVNTCAFIQPAKEESIDEILTLARHKTGSRARKLLVTGCLAQRYGCELLKDMPEIDGAFGLGELDAAASACADGMPQRRAQRTPASQLAYIAGAERYISDALPYAYLKISDGCNRGCTFCSIPSIRGRYRSRTQEAIIAEARFLARHGKREIILVSQDSTLYGYDLGPGQNLVTLLGGLEKIERIEWIRVLYLYPAQVEDELISMVASSRKVVSYFDLPLQHASSDVLRAMGRSQTREDIEKLLERIRRLCPGAVRRVTFMVGFPGETEAAFDELMEFVLAHRFERVGCFTYWPEENTAAAGRGDPIAYEEKARRLDLLMSRQCEVATEANNSLIGSIQQVMIDVLEEEGLAVGRSCGDCPDIDQIVRVRGAHLVAGEVHDVRVVASDGYDLVAEQIEA